MLRHVLCLAVGVLAACSSETAPGPANREAAAAPVPARPDDMVDEVAAAELPAEVVKVVEAAVPGIRIDGATRKEREGRIYFDVEGMRPDGSEVELDLLGENGAFRVVEIQRDIAWAEVPANAKAEAAKAPNAFEPVRVIESRETDGSVIYELFSSDRTDKPALEVRVADGRAALLTEAWPH